MQKIDRSGTHGGRAGQYFRGSGPGLIALGLAALLCLGTPANLYSQVAILQVRVIEGEGAVHATGSKASHPIVVQVTDETGSPVEGATVSFRLPDEGATGIMASGVRTDLVTTDAQGRAALRGLQFGRTPGQLQIRITAAKGEARAGTLSTQFLTGKGAAAIPAVIAAATPLPAGPLATAPGSPAWTPNSSNAGFVKSGVGDSHRTRWIVIGLAVAAGAGAGFALRGHGSSNPSTNSGSLPPNIGAPTITIGHP